MQFSLVRADALRIAGGWLARFSAMKLLPWALLAAVGFYGYVQLLQAQRDGAASAQALAERVAQAAEARTDALDAVLAGLANLEQVRRTRATDHRQAQLGVGAARDQSLDLPVPPAVLRILRPDALPPRLEPDSTSP